MLPDVLPLSPPHTPVCLQSHWGMREREPTPPAPTLAPPPALSAWWAPGQLPKVLAPAVALAMWQRHRGGEPGTGRVGGTCMVAVAPALAAAPIPAGGGSTPSKWTRQPRSRP